LRVGIIGLGYVGLPLAVEFAEAGAEVVAADLDARKVAAIEARESYIEDIASERLAAVNSRIRATTRYALLARADAVIICVPTPLTPNREPDLGPLLGAAQGLRDVLQAGQLVVLESTTFRGTTRHHLAPILQESGLDVGTDFNLAFSPERVDPGRTDFTMRNTPKVVGGMTEACADRAADLYGKVCDHRSRDR
jgi:UDP-N-acetyl-D-glucosamine dehydrogenase